MQCTLLIPHLFWPGKTAAAVTQGLLVPQLVTLLARARCDRPPALTPEAWMCQAFEVDRQQDWPIAPLTLAIDGGEPGTHYWLRADPVHLRVDRDRLLLVDNALFDICVQDAQSLVATLNAHFAQSGIAFHSHHPKRWYVKLSRPPALSTHTLSSVAGNDVQHYLPSGAEGLAWHSLFNEIQMLLHEHAVNQRREARGEPPLNSVWFWGGGTRPAVPGRSIQRVWSDNATALGLAAASDTPSAGLPGGAAAWLKDIAPSDKSADSHLITIDDLASAVDNGDSDAWRARILALEENWFAPLVRALRARRLSQVTLVAVGETHCWRFVMRRLDVFKIWRRSPSLCDYA